MSSLSYLSRQKQTRPTEKAHAAGNTYYVANNGSDSNPCTQSAPCQTITTGLTKLSAGDTLYIRGGTYDESLTAAYTSLVWPSGTSWSNAVTIAGYPGETATITGGIAIGDNNDGSIVSYLIFDNLTIRNSHGNAFWVGYNSHHIRLINSDLATLPNGGSNVVQISGYIIDRLPQCVDRRRGCANLHRCRTSCID
jgi:hypothetical protein